MYDIHMFYIFKSAYLCFKSKYIVGIIWRVDVSVLY